jgi:hypothetical protein
MWYYTKIIHNRSGVLQTSDTVFVNELFLKGGGGGDKFAITLPVQVTTPHPPNFIS